MLPELKPIIYSTRGKEANHYTTDAFLQHQYAPKFYIFLENKYYV